MKKVWIVPLALVIAVVTYLYIVQPPAPLPGEEITYEEPPPAPSRTTKVVRPKPQWELPPGFEQPPRDYSYLPESKHAAVIKAEEENAEESRRLTTAGKQDAAAIEVLKKLQAKLDQRLSQILTPEEKFEYDLRNSIIAQSLRTSLYPMETTDAEFRAIYRHRYRFEQRVDKNPSDIDIAWKECDASIRSSIGDDRFEKYQLTYDKDFLDIYHFFRGERVEPEIVDKLYVTWSKAGTSADAIRLNEGISTEAKQQQLKELAKTCMHDMEQILGTGPGSDKLEERGMNLLAMMESLKPRKARRSPEFLDLQPGLVIMKTAQ